VLLLVVMAFVGAFAAPACGFRSRIAASFQGLPAPERRGRLLPILILGVALGIAVALADHATRALWQASPATPPSLVEAWSPVGLLVGVLYGGVVEEITMRFGLMSLVVLGVRQIGGAGAGPASGVAVTVGILVSAALFAAGHLPALAAAGIALEPPLVARTLLWNGLLGIVFGVLFARRDLESAMAAHAGFHLGLLPALLIALVTAA
jgi:hypothetical protein